MSSLDIPNMKYKINSNSGIVNNDQIQSHHIEKNVEMIRNSNSGGTEVNLCLELPPKIPHVTASYSPDYNLDDNDETNDQPTTTRDSLNMDDINDLIKNSKALPESVIDGEINNQHIGEPSIYNFSMKSGHMNNVQI